MSNAQIVAIFLVAFLVLGFAQVTVQIVRHVQRPKPYIPAHGDHEPSWTTVGVSYQAPVDNGSVRGRITDQVIDRLMRGESHITQECVGFTTQGLRCGRVRVLHETGRVNLHGFHWSE